MTFRNEFYENDSVERKENEEMEQNVNVNIEFRVQRNEFDRECEE